MMYQLKTISYAYLLALREKGARNGSILKLSHLKKGLFSAALAYAKLMKKITNSKLIIAIESVADLIENSIRRKIVRHGLERATLIANNPKIIRAVGAVRQWVQCDSFIFWLGTDVLARKSWIWVI